MSERPRPAYLARHEFAEALDAAQADLAERTETEGDTDLGDALTRIADHDRKKNQ